MKKSAFTLLELLVVIAIIAILASIMLPVFLKAVEKARLTTDTSNLKQIGIALLSYQNDNGGKMPPDGTAGSFVVSAQGTNQILLNYSGKSFAVWHSPFDLRQGPEGDNYPISYSINQKVLSPTSAASPGTWTGDPSNALVAPSTLLVASPSFTGNPGTSAAWGNSVASSVQALTKSQAQHMILTGSCYRLMPALFADSHVTTVQAVNYQNGPNGVAANDVEWDPMVPNATP